jgi:HAD superfamily hydrolase (TIGR01509 family)
MKPELIIFDCDGTLTDSEGLNNQAVADVFADMGYPQYDYDFCLNSLVGMTVSATKKVIEEKEGKKLPDDFAQRFINLVQHRLKSGLRPVPYAVESVDVLSKKYKVCVASNGERSNVIESVRAIGVYDYFGDGCVFTKSQVPRGKPFPDLFLYAANKMDVKPENCVVVEDSLPGVQAGVAAGMQVIGITAVSHDPARLTEDMKKIGVSAVFHTWQDILNYIN